MNRPLVKCLRRAQNTYFTLFSLFFLVKPLISSLICSLYGGFLWWRVQKKRSIFRVRGCSLHRGLIAAKNRREDRNMRSHGRCSLKEVILYIYEMVQWKLNPLSSSNQWVNMSIIQEKKRIISEDITFSSRWPCAHVWTFRCLNELHRRSMLYFSNWTIVRVVVLFRTVSDRIRRHDQGFDTIHFRVR